MNENNNFIDTLIGGLNIDIATFEITDTHIDETVDFVINEFGFGEEPDNGAGMRRVCQEIFKNMNSVFKSKKVLQQFSILESKNRYDEMIKILDQPNYLKKLLKWEPHSKKGKILHSLYFKSTEWPEVTDYFEIIEETLYILNYERYDLLENNKCIKNFLQLIPGEILELIHLQTTKPSYRKEFKLLKTL